MMSTPAASMATWMRRVALAIASITLTLLVMEVGVRGYQEARDGVPFAQVTPTYLGWLETAPRHAPTRPSPHGVVPNPKLGWRPRPNLHFEGVGANADGSTYHMGSVKQRAGATSVVVFEVSLINAPYYPAIRRIAQRHGLHFVERLPAVLYDAENKHHVVKVDDHIHWNGEGHRVIAKALTEYLTSHHLVRARIDTTLPTVTTTP